MAFVGLAKGRKEREEMLLSNARGVARYNSQVRAVVGIFGAEAVAKQIGKGAYADTKEEVLKHFLDLRAAKRMPASLDKEIADAVESGDREGFNSIDGGI